VGVVVLETVSVSTSLLDSPREVVYKEQKHRQWTRDERCEHVEITQLNLCQNLWNDQAVNLAKP
jgi:hypothetical protein